MRLPCLCPVDSPLWQRVVVDLCQTRAATQRTPPPLPSARWQDGVTNTEVLEHAGSLSMSSLLIQRRLRWLGHAYRMERDRLPREILYGELREGVRCVGRPLLRYKDVIKRDLRSALIDTSTWEDIANHQDTWWQSVKMGFSKAEANAIVQATCKRAARKERTASARYSTRHVCATCNLRDCHSGQDRATQSCKILPKSPALTSPLRDEDATTTIIYILCQPTQLTTN